MNMNFKPLKEKIDEYIRKRIDLILHTHIKQTIKDTLGPMCAEYLDNNLKGMLREAVEDALDDLATEFDITPFSEDSSDSKDPSVEEEAEVLPPVPQAPYSMCFDSEEEKTEKSVQLLAFIQYYKEKHGEDAIPTSSTLFEHLGLESMELSELYSELIASGYIQREMGKKKYLKILTPLSSPSNYLKNPL